jgi:hypothetical protein
VGKFALEIEFDGALHAPAYRAVIARVLDDCRQAVRSTAQMAGELKVPVAHVPDPITVEIEL